LYRYVIVKVGSRIQKGVTMVKTLKAYRNEAGLTQWKLAVALGFQISTIQRIEAGQPPSLATALKLAKFFNVHVEDIDWFASKTLATIAA
jgi:DNA-binding XRE family transcriptional regulator